MKKKLIAIFLAGAMLGSLTACGSQEETPLSSDVSSDDSDRQDTTEGGGALCEGAPEDSGSMLSVVDSLIMAITENDLPYDSEDPAAFWTELAYLIGRDGEKSPEARHNNEQELVLPAEAVQEYAAAMFAGYDREEALPEMPRDDMMLRYNAEKDTYTLQPGDFGLTETRMIRCTDEGDGVYTLRADFVDSTDDSVLSSWEIVMAKDTGAKTDSLYFYRVADIRCLISVDNTEEETTQTENSQTEEEPITLDDAVNILYEMKADELNLDRALDDCFVSPDGSTASIEGHTCYTVQIYADVSKENLLGSYYVQTNGESVYAYNNVTGEYNKIY